MRNGRDKWDQKWAGEIGGGNGGAEKWGAGKWGAGKWAPAAKLALNGAHSNAPL